MKGHDEIIELVLYFLCEGDNFKGKAKKQIKWSLVLCSVGKCKRP